MDLFSESVEGNDGGELTVDTLNRAYEHCIKDFVEPSLVVMSPKTYKAYQVIQRYWEMLGDLVLQQGWLSNQKYRKLSRFLRKRGRILWPKYCLKQARFEIEEGV